MRDLANIFDSLRRAQAELEDTVARIIEADPSDQMNLARLQELAARNAESARLIAVVVAAQSSDAQQSQMLSELQGLATSFEKTEAALAARLGVSGPDRTQTGEPI
jgi:seryl-tRNA synthetase